MNQSTTDGRPVPRRRSDPAMANYVYKSSNGEDRAAKMGQAEPAEQAAEPDKKPEK